jgi:hypothetical protein
MLIPAAILIAACVSLSSLDAENDLKLSLLGYLLCLGYSFNGSAYISLSVFER